jgi:hypothetical protein
MSSMSQRSSWILFVDPVSRILFVPWGLAYLNNCFDESWSRTVAAYGLHMSALTIGRLMGKLLHSNLVLGRPYLLWTFLQNCLILGFSYLLIAFTTRFTLIFISFFLIGLSGASIGVIASSSKLSFNFNIMRCLQLTSTLAIKINSNTHINCNQFHATSMTLCFLPVFSGLFYNTSVFARFPPFWPCFIFASICLSTVSLVIYSDFFVGKGSSSKRFFALDGLGSTTDSSLHSNTRGVGGFHKNDCTILGNSGGGGSGRFSQSLGHNQSHHHQQQNNNYHNLHSSSRQTSTVPHRYLIYYHNDIDKAMKAFQASLQWRQQHRIEHILAEPQPGFSDLLRLYPHAIHGISKDGCIVVYEVSLYLQM